MKSSSLVFIALIGYLTLVAEPITVEAQSSDVKFEYTKVQPVALSRVEIQALRMIKSLKKPVEFDSLSQTGQEMLFSPRALDVESIVVESDGYWRWRTRNDIALLNRDKGNQGDAQILRRFLNPVINQCFPTAKRNPICYKEISFYQKQAYIHIVVNKSDIEMPAPRENAYWSRDIEPKEKSPTFLLSVKKENATITSLGDLSEGRKNTWEKVSRYKALNSIRDFERNFMEVPNFARDRQGRAID